MCLKPLRITTRSRLISRNLNQRFFCDVPCGNCSDCRSLKRDEWFLRSYFHALKFIKEGGYFYFDTLTYKPGNLPHVGDYLRDVVFEKLDKIDNLSCFSRMDIRLFLVRLRRYLSYAGYDVKDKLDYFIVGEYGSDQNYISDKGFVRRGTSAPHYHILLFVDKDLKLEPEVLSEFVDKSWQLGRTDGWMYEHVAKDGKPYNFFDHVYGKAYTHDLPEDQLIRKVTSYVTGYVNKSSSYKHRVTNILYNLYNEIYGSSWSDSLELQKEYRTVVRNILEFHVQSHGFGDYYFQRNDFDYEDLLKRGCVTVPDSKLIKRDIVLPLYYERKIFYSCVTQEDGTRQWQPTEASFDWLKAKFFRNVDKVEKRYRDFYFCQNDIVKNYLAELLGNRSVRDFAIYLLAYRGRIISDKAFHRKLPDELMDVILWNQLCNNKDNFARDLYSYNYSCQDDRINFGKKFLSNKLMIDADGEYIYKRNIDFSDEIDNLPTFSELCRKKNIITIPAKDLSKVYSENFCQEFENFDKIYELYKSINSELNSMKDDAGVFRDSYIDRLVSVGFKISK